MSETLKCAKCGAKMPRRTKPGWDEKFMCVGPRQFYTPKRSDLIKTCVKCRRSSPPGGTEAI